MKKTVLIFFIFLLGVFALTASGNAEGTEGGRISMIDSKNNEVKALAVEFREVEGQKMILLRELGRIYDWNFFYIPEDKTVIIESKKQKVEAWRQS